MPLEAATAITETAFFNSSPAFSEALAAKASSRPRITFFILVFAERFLTRRSSLCLALLIADLWFANPNLLEIDGPK
jgi:hypothetical protein